LFELASERLTADFVSTPTAEMPVNSSRCNTYPDAIARVSDMRAACYT